MNEEYAAEKDIFFKCGTAEGYFGALRAAGDRYYTMPMMESVPGKTMTFEGRDCLMWSINNYLGLAENQDIKAEALEALKTWGISGPMGSRMMSGNTAEHIELEEQLASFSGKESSILFNYGYLGVLGTISALVGPDDIIIMDKLVHASIIDAAFGAVADRKQIRVFRHNDMTSLEERLKSVDKTRKGGVIILTEGVYGMTGDLANLKDICDIKERYGARLFTDDAHGCGVMGPTGRGTGEYFGVQDKIDLYFATFAKAFAAIGGYTASTKDAVEWMRYNARTQVFAKSLPMVYVKALMKTLALVREGDERRKQLFAVSRSLSDGLRELGFYVGRVDSPLVAVYVPQPDEQIAMEWIHFLREKGIFVTAVSYPVIPRGYVMFRMVPTASHDEADVARTLAAFKSLREEKRLALEYDEKALARIYRGAE